MPTADHMTSQRTVKLPEASLYWPNKMARTYLLALEDVMGKNGLNAILNQSGLGCHINNYPPENLDLCWSFDKTSALRCAMDEMHGIQGGKAIAVRAGRAWYHRAVSDFAAVLGIGDLAFRLLPFGTRIRLYLGAMADTFNKTSHQVVQVLEQDDTTLLYRVQRCPECWGRSASQAICQTDSGLVQEALHSVAAGREFQVEEVQCIAKGDPFCTYSIRTRA